MPNNCHLHDEKALAACKKIIMGKLRECCFVNDIMSHKWLGVIPKCKEKLESSIKSQRSENLNKEYKGSKVNILML